MSPKATSAQDPGSMESSQTQRKSDPGGPSVSPFHSRCPGELLCDGEPARCQSAWIWGTHTILGPGQSLSREPGHLGSNPSSAVFYLRDLGRVTRPLCTSSPLSAKR